MIPKPMKHSQDITSLIRSFEGCRLTAYWDGMGECWTIGYGHTAGVTKGMTITLKEAYEFLNKDLEETETAVNRMVTVQLTQPEYDAIVDFAFNLGWVRLHNSTMLKLINTERFAEAAKEFDKWDLSRGNIVAGLLRRRQAETNLFESGMNENGAVHA